MDAVREIVMPHITRIRGKKEDDEVDNTAIEEVKRKAAHRSGGRG